jgi:hypothetical protein
MRSPRLSIAARSDFVGYAGQLLAPPIILGSLAGAVRHRRAAVAAAVLGGYACTAAAIGFDALRWEQGPDGGPLPVEERLRRALRLTLFGAIWLAAVPAALWRLAIRGGPVRYDKMAHDGRGDSVSPELDAFYQRQSEGAAAGLPR